jgi:hypothetical protein
LEAKSSTSRHGEGVANDDDNTAPTIVFEVAYTQTSRNLATRGSTTHLPHHGAGVLVLVIDIIHERNTCPRKLHSVTWSHWEDVGAYGVVTKQDDDEVNELRERKHGEDDALHVLRLSLH